MNIRFRYSSSWNFYRKMNFTYAWFDPYWNVPESIVINKVLPSIRKSKNYLGSAMHLGKEKSVYIAKRVPVFIAYFTAFIDRDGKLNFIKDI